jgi:hypothetical protein
MPFNWLDINVFVPRTEMMLKRIPDEQLVIGYWAWHDYFLVWELNIRVEKLNKLSKNYRRWRNLYSESHEEKMAEKIKVWKPIFEARVEKRKKRIEELTNQAVGEYGEFFNMLTTFTAWIVTAFVFMIALGIGGLAGHGVYAFGKWLWAIWVWKMFFAIVGGIIGAVIVASIAAIATKHLSERVRPVKISKRNGFFKAIGKPFYAFGRFVWYYVKSVKENHCPAITWID